MELNVYVCVCQRHDINSAAERHATLRMLAACDATPLAAAERRLEELLQNQPISYNCTLPLDGEAGLVGHSCLRGDAALIVSLIKFSWLRRPLCLRQT